MLLATQISSYGCIWEVWRALKKLELLSAAPRTTLTLLSCSLNFPQASITQYTYAKHEPILNCQYASSQGACVTVAALLQYFLMAAFCWMLVEGIYLYLLVVKVYNIENKMYIYHVMSWGKFLKDVFLVKCLFWLTLVMVLVYVIVLQVFPLSLSPCL